MVQNPGLRSPNSVALAQPLAGASRPHKQCGTEGEGKKEKTKPTNKQETDKTLTNGESKTKHTKTHKERHFHTHTKKRKRQQKRAIKSTNKPINENKTKNW